MRCLYFVYVGLVLVYGWETKPRSIDDHIDSGMCTGEIRAGNSPFVPHRYTIYLDINPVQKNFRGEVNISGTLSRESGNTIELHSVRLNVSSVRVNGVGLGDTDWYTDDDNGTLIIMLPNNALHPKPSNLVVGVSYKGVFNETTGIIMQHYNKTDDRRWIIFTHLEPISARTVFPCIDLPKYKARFDIRIKNNFPDRTVLSNMPPIKSKDRRIIKFHTSPLMSTYLVSFVVCDYVPFKTGVKKYKTRPITTWVPKEMKKKYEIKYVIAVTPFLLEALENYTGNSYSLPKLDMYDVMDKPGIGGMENWGLIMYQADSLMGGKRVSANDLTRIIFTITHELAHHWFGNSVTVADWCGMWFQEAIPTFLHGRIPKDLSPDLDMENRVKWTARKEVMDSECFFYDESSPLRDVDNPRADESILFSLVRYFKGANLLYMIESMVTPEVFKSALRSFSHKYNNSYATEGELWDVVESEVGNGGIKDELNAPVSLGEIAETWVTNRSHPIVVLNRNKNGELSVTQRVCIQKFLMDGEWWIPVSYTTSTEKNFDRAQPRKLISPMNDGELQPLDVKLKNDEWIILNIKGSGFYRVEYDKHTWGLLVDQLERDAASDFKDAVIPPIHRAMLIDDSFHTANSGEGLVKVFKILGYIKREKSPYAWEAMMINADFLAAELPEEEKTLFQKYIHFLLKNVFERVTNTTQWRIAYYERLEDVDERSLREPVFGLSKSVKLPEIFPFSKKVALQVINGTMEEKIIPPEIRNTMWCAAVSTGNQAIFDYVKKTYDSEGDDKKKAQIFERLRCSKNHTKLLLNLLLKVSGGSKADLLKDVKEFLVYHWPAECEEILSFIENHKMQLVDNDSQLASEFQGYVRNPLSECKEKTKTLFETNLTDDVDDEIRQGEWKKTYGDKPLHWLRENEPQWS